MPVTAFVSIRLERQNETTIAGFEKGVGQLDKVIACYLMSGRHDYLLQVLSKSLKDYEIFIRERLTRIPGVGSLESYFAFGQVKRQMVFPKIPT